VAIDVRLIAATNVNLDEAVAAGRFREDLYYRLHVATVNLPQLRERPGDILPLAHHFLSVYGSRLGFVAARLSAEAADQLLNYPWPGNIRELENTLHHALVVCPGTEIRATDLRLPTTRAHVRVRAEATGQSLVALTKALELLFLEESPQLYQLIDDTIFRAAYEHCGENQLRTARLLGISRNIVRDRLLRYGLLGSQKAAS
jgi:sigma-54-specific transcriptional regulator